MTESGDAVENVLILSVTPNPDLHGLIHLISIDNICVILLSTHVVVNTRKKYLIRIFNSFRCRMCYFSGPFIFLNSVYTVPCESIRPP